VSNIKLPEFVTSPQDLGALILDVSEYSNWKGHESIKKRMGVQAESKRPEISANAERFIHEWINQQPEGSKDADKLFDELQALKNNLPTVTITLADSPSNGLKSAIVKWCRENVSPSVLISFRFNSTILGGMVVQIGSKMFDWSFRKQILENRQKFPEVMRRV
jgi:hypothetical protein